MILGSADGTVFTLDVVAYEFALDHPGVTAEDLAWLVVEGSVVLPDGRSWAFRDPALMVDEAVDLGDWLHGSEPHLEFVEPLLAFDCEDVGERVAVRVALGHEALPPWLTQDVPGEWLTQTYALELDVTSEQLVAAAAAWREQVDRFPARSLPGEPRRGLRRLFGR